MKLIVLSKSNISDEETGILLQLFKNGLTIFHLRKPGASKDQIERFLKFIPQKYLNRIVLHSRHELAPKYGLKGIHLTGKHRKSRLKTWLHVRYLKTRHPSLTVSTSFHSLETLMECKEQYDYVFLSPVFDSISKDKHYGKFAGHNLSVIFEKLDHKVIALGGVGAANIEKTREMGFSGAALLGAVWTSKNPVASFNEIKAKCQQQDMVSA